MVQQSKTNAMIISSYFSRDAVVVVPVLLVKVFGDYNSSVIVLDILTALSGESGVVERGLSYWGINYALTPDALHQAHRSLARSGVVVFKEVSMNIFSYTFDSLKFADYFVSKSTRIINRESKVPKIKSGKDIQEEREKKMMGTDQGLLDAILSDYNMYANIENCVFGDKDYSLVRALVKKGYTLEDFKKVHSVQSELLRKKDTRKYFVPVILYKLENFEKYLSQWRVQNKSGYADSPIDGAVSKSFDAGLEWVKKNN